MGMGTWSSSQVLHTWSRVVFPALPATPGRFRHLDFSTEEVTPGFLLGTKLWLSYRGKCSFFLLSLFPKFSANTSLFHRWGNADLPALFFSPFAEFKPRKSSANMLVLHSFLFAKSSKPSPKAAAAHVSLQSGGM